MSRRVIDILTKALAARGINCALMSIRRTNTPLRLPTRLSLAQNFRQRPPRSVLVSLSAGNGNKFLSLQNRLAG
jgi:hypothetical protein